MTKPTSRKGAKATPLSFQRSKVCPSTVHAMDRLMSVPPQRDSGQIERHFRQLIGRAEAIAGDASESISVIQPGYEWRRYGDRASDRRRAPVQQGERSQ